MYMSIHICISIIFEIFRDKVSLKYDLRDDLCSCRIQDVYAQALGPHTHPHPHAPTLTHMVLLAVSST
jgi:hypothetical protein